MSDLRRISAIEGVQFQLEAGLRDRLRTTCYRLHKLLKLSFPPLQEDERGFRIYNLVGALDLGGGVVVDVEPKTQPGENWVRSILSLLVGDEPLDLAADESSDKSAARPDLLEALAAAYARRLERALRRDGPLLVMQRTAAERDVLVGKLNVARWVRDVWTRPTRFPVSYSTLTAENDYSQTLAFVALGMARRTRYAGTKAKLFQCAKLLRPGLPEPHSPPAGVEHRQLPQQWSVYQPAWSIACAVLARRSLLGPHPHEHGLSIAVEAWPLLETLLERCIASAVRQGLAQGRSVSTIKKGPRRILERKVGLGPASHNVEPDGLLLENDFVVASLEAKYRDYDPAEGPQRHEIYQAVAAARAVSAPLAVLVYPGAFETAHWNIDGGPFAPTQLAAVGLDMFNYQRGGEDARGAKLLSLVT